MFDEYDHHHGTIDKVMNVYSDDNIENVIDMFLKKTKKLQLT